jgi:hypothetical protein
MPVAYSVSAQSTVALGQATAKPFDPFCFVSGRQIIRPKAVSARAFWLQFEIPGYSFLQSPLDEAVQNLLLDGK